MENGNIDRLIITLAILFAVAFFVSKKFDTRLGYLVLVIVLAYGMFDKLRRILK